MLTCARLSHRPKTGPSLGVALGLGLSVSLIACKPRGGGSSVDNESTKDTPRAKVVEFWPTDEGLKSFQFLGEGKACHRGAVQAILRYNHAPDRQGPIAQLNYHRPLESKNIALKHQELRQQQQQQQPHAIILTTPLLQSEHSDPRAEDPTAQEATPRSAPLQIVLEDLYRSRALSAMASAGLRLLRHSTLLPRHKDHPINAILFGPNCEGPIKEDLAGKLGPDLTADDLKCHARASEDKYVFEAKFDHLFFYVGGYQKYPQRRELERERRNANRFVFVYLNDAPWHEWKLESPRKTIEGGFADGIVVLPEIYDQCFDAVFAALTGAESARDPWMIVADRSPLLATPAGDEGVYGARPIRFADYERERNSRAP